jgi:dipeptidyl aminopeptidase/acylaminoacyl peptidase
MRVLIRVAACVALSVPLVAQGQAPPATEIYLASLTSSGQTIRVGAPVNITKSPGYDNQPYFLPDSSALLFSSNRDGSQTDIYRHDVLRRILTQVTKTPENEYSPTVTPDRRTFTTVRGAEQRLWRFNLNGSDAGLAYAHRGLIGYHAWISPTQVAAFILGAQGAPNTLELIDIRTGAAQVVESSIGRSLHIRPRRGTVSFVHKVPGGPWMIKEVEPGTGRVTPLTPAVEGSEDLAWTPDGAIVMGAKSKLFMWTERDNRWVEIADLAASGVTAITRLAVSPDGKWIAIVSTP